MSITSIDHVSITVAALDDACAFYDRVFGCETVHEYRIGGKIWLRQIRLGGKTGPVLSMIQEGIPAGGAAKPTVGAVDMCFRWNGTIESAVAHLNAHDVAVEIGPSKRFFSDGRPSQSIYFRDLDNNIMELMAADPGREPVRETMSISDF